MDKKIESKKCWWNDTIAEEIKNKKEAYLTWLNTKTKENRQMYREKRERVKEMIQDEKRNVWDRKCRQVETYIGGRRCTEAWNFISNIRWNGNHKNCK